MLKRNLVAAMFCATFSLAMSQSVVAGLLSQEEFNKMSEKAVEQQQAPTGTPAPEHSASQPAQGARSVEQVQAQAPAVPEPDALPPGTQPGEPPVPVQKPSATPSAGQQPVPMEDRRAVYDRPGRARGPGADMPGKPPWAGRGMGMGRQYMSDEERAAHREAMSKMSPEERRAYRAQMHERMRERAWEEGVVLPETPPWEPGPAQTQPIPQAPTWAERMAAYRDRVNKMSPEDREACQALSRMEMRERMHRVMREMSARMQQYRQEFMPRHYPQSGYGQDYPYMPEGGGYPMGPEPGYGMGYPPAWGGPGAGYGPDSMTPPEDYGSGYPPAPGYGSPW